MLFQSYLHAKQRIDEEGENETLLIHPIALTDTNFSPNEVTDPKGPLVSVSTPET